MEGRILVMSMYTRFTKVEVSLNGLEGGIGILFDIPYREFNTCDIYVLYNYFD